MRADDADIEVDDAGPQRQDGLGAREQDADPLGPVGDPLRVDDLGALDAQDRGDVLDERLLDRARARQRRRGEREPVRRAADRDEAGAALLGHHAVGGRGARGR